MAYLAKVSEIDIDGRIFEYAPSAPGYWNPTTWSP